MYIVQCMIEISPERCPRCKSCRPSKLSREPYLSGRSWWNSPAMSMSMMVWWYCLCPWWLDDIIKAVEEKLTVSSCRGVHCPLWWLNDIIKRALRIKIWPWLRALKRKNLLWTKYSKKEKRENKKKIDRVSVHPPFSPLPRKAARSITIKIPHFHRHNFHRRLSRHNLRFEVSGYFHKILASVDKWKVERLRCQIQKQAQSHYKGSYQREGDSKQNAFFMKPR